MKHRDSKASIGIITHSESAQRSCKSTPGYKKDLVQLPDQLINLGSSPQLRFRPTSFIHLHMLIQLILTHNTDEVRNSQRMFWASQWTLLAEGSARSQLSTNVDCVFDALIFRSVESSLKIYYILCTVVLLLANYGLISEAKMSTCTDETFSCIDKLLKKAKQNYLIEG